MKKVRHKLLQRQMVRELKGLEARLVTEDRQNLERFLEAVNRAYLDFEEDMKLLERTMELSAQEVTASIGEQARLNVKIEAQQANMLNASKMSELGRMAAGVAHEINNPLAIIKGRSQQVRHLLTQPNPDLDKLDHYASGIEITVDRIAKIVSGLKTFSRDASQDPFVSFNLSQIVTDTLALCSEKFKMQSFRIETDIPPHVEINCRATQISQVLLNLLNNSFDAILNLSEKWVKIQFEVLPDEIRLTMTDSGSGIPEHIRETIFHPFFTTKEVGKGTGLGLSISANVIASHGGRLYLDSSSPNTKFVIGFPKSILVSKSTAA